MNNNTLACRTIRELLSDLDDPYTRFITPQQFAAMMVFDPTGIGLNLGSTDEYQRKVGFDSPVEQYPADVRLWLQPVKQWCCWLSVNQPAALKLCCRLGTQKSDIVSGVRQPLWSTLQSVSFSCFTARLCLRVSSGTVSILCLWTLLSTRWAALAAILCDKH